MLASNDANLRRIVGAGFCALTLALAGCGSSQNADLQQRIAEADARPAEAEKRLAAATADSDARPVPAPVAPVVTQPQQDPVEIDLGKGSSARRDDAPFRDSHSGPNNDIP